MLYYTLYFMYHVLRIIYICLHYYDSYHNVIAMMMIFAYYQSTFINFITVYVLYRISYIHNNNNYSDLGFMFLPQKGEKTPTMPGIEL